LACRNRELMRDDCSRDRGMNRFIRLLAQMGAWIILVSCGQTATSPPSAPLAEIRIGCGVVNPDASPLWVAEESGFFKKNGIAIDDIVPYRGNAPTIQALVSGDIQFAITSPPEVIETSAAGSGLVMIMSLNSTLNYEFVVQPGLTKSQDLKGKKFGVSGRTGSSMFALRYTLRTYFNLNPEKDVSILFIGNDEDRLAALQTRQTDGTMLNPDVAIKARRIGLVSLVSLWDKGMPYQGQGLVISRDYAGKNRGVVRAFVRSVTEAIAFCKDPKNKEAVKKAMRKYLKTSDADYIDAGYNRMANRILQPVPSVTEEGMKTIIAESKLAKKKGLKVSDVVDNSYVRELEESGFIEGLYKKGKVIGEK
jgi:NitT/TauT family transport system substrate-binding protein